MPEKSAEWQGRQPERGSPPGRATPEALPLPVPPLLSHLPFPSFSPSEKLLGLLLPLSANPHPLHAHSLVLGRQVVEDIGDRDGREGQHEDPSGCRSTHRRRRPAACPSLHPAQLPRPGFRQRLQLSPEPSERPVTRPVRPARPAPLPCAQPPAAAVQTREAPSLPSRQGAPRDSRQLGELGGGDSPLPGTGAPVTLCLCAGRWQHSQEFVMDDLGRLRAELWASGGRSQTRGVRVGRACKSIHVGNPRSRVQKGQMTLKPGNLSTESHQRAASTVPAWRLKPHFQP